MSRPNPNSVDAANLRQRAMSRWDNEGGAGPDGPPVVSGHNGDKIAVPEMTNAELVALHVRMIALENLAIALLATASDQQLELAREMAGYISPRPGSTQHPLTVRAAEHRC